MLLKHSLVTTWRTLRRNKLFTLINILGLSIGISASLVIYLIADHEFSYDRFEPGRDRIYKVVMDARFPGALVHSGAVPAPLWRAIQREVTGVALTIPVFQYQDNSKAKVAVLRGGRPVVFPKETAVIYTGPQYFQIMPYRWIAGSPDVSMKEPFSVVLTRSRARLYFPGLRAADVVGRRLTYNDDMTVTVSGVVDDLAENTDMGGREFISLATVSQTRLKGSFEMEEWNDWMAYSQLYLQLAPGIDPRDTEKQLAGLYQKYGRHDPRHPEDGFHFFLLPLKESHFNADYRSLGQRTASRPVLYGLLAVAAFLLLLACLNFINLSTAQAVRRAREIGIRKTLGSSRSRLIRQFLGETFLLVMCATLFSLALAPLLLFAFSGFIPPGLHADWLHRPGAIVFLVGLTVFISGAAGFYPAFFLSRFKPVKVLKDGWFTAAGRGSGVWMRKTFTVSQFVIAQFFIIATLMVGKQMRYSLDSDLGFRKDAVVTFDLPFDTVTAHRTALLAQIRAIPEVEMAASGFLPPADWGNAVGNVVYKLRPDVRAQVFIRWGDSSYLPLYQIRLLAGRNVRQSDTAREVLINAMYAAMLGFRRPEDALNRMLTVDGRDLPIVGVMADFHEASMHNAIGPLAFYGAEGSTFHVRLRAAYGRREAWQRGIRKIERAFRRMYPAGEWDYTFLDDTIAKWYTADRGLAHLLNWAMGLTILISCLGLLGLVVYTTNMRTREIGIRKVLGASAAAIAGILSGEFMRLVALAFVIATPVAWWAADRWLQAFAYRTAMSWWVFVAGGVLLFLFALATLSFQTVRAARANPVKSLRVD